jgi:hypothetical protein
MDSQKNKRMSKKMLRAKRSEKRRKEKETSLTYIREKRMEEARLRRRARSDNGMTQEEEDAQIVIGHFSQKNLPLIDERPAVMRPSDLGSEGVPGLMAALLGRYVSSLMDRLLENEMLKPYIFLEFGFSELPQAEFVARWRLHGSGGTNIPIMPLLLSEDMPEVILGIEAKMRDTIAQFDEHSPNKIQSFLFGAIEHDQKLNPGEAFDVPKGLKRSVHLESEISL